MDNTLKLILLQHRNGAKFEDTKESLIRLLGGDNLESQQSKPTQTPEELITASAKEMYEAINYTLNYDSREEGEKNDYEVRFLYPANNLSYQKLLKASNTYNGLKEYAAQSKLTVSDEDCKHDWKLISQRFSICKCTKCGEETED